MVLWYRSGIKNVHSEKGIFVHLQLFEDAEFDYLLRQQMDKDFYPDAYRSDRNGRHLRAFHLHNIHPRGCLGFLSPHPAILIYEQIPCYSFFLSLCIKINHSLFCAWSLTVFVKKARQKTRLLSFVIRTIFSSRHFCYIIYQKRQNAISDYEIYFILVY